MILMARVRVAYKTAASNVVLGGNLRDCFAQTFKSSKQNISVYKYISFAPSLFQIQFPFDYPWMINGAIGKLVKSRVNNKTKQVAYLYMFGWANHTREFVMPY